MRIMGIDPGARATGYAVVEGEKALAFGHVSPEGELPDRLRAIHEEICRVMDEMKPEKLVMEAVIYHKNVSTAIIMGAARGVVLLAAAQHSIPVHEVSPTTVKKAVTGTGRAGKEGVEFMVRRLYGITGELSEHAADALAMAWCGQVGLE